jgi:plasmid stability protein
MAQDDGKMTLTIRTSPSLHKWLKAQAKKHGRSLNREVEAALLRYREGEEAGPLLEEMRRILAAVKR